MANANGTRPIRVLFVCLGNICRSPMAEAVFADLVQQAGLKQYIEADSAGLDDWHVGETPHHGTMEELRRNGISYRGHSRLIQPHDLDEFDYIVTMDDSNLRGVLTLGKGKARVAPLLSYVEGFGTEVPDPYYVGGFEKVFRMVQAGAGALLETIRAEHNLP